ncbi:hypothetical protein FBU59_005917, partial [Linderina macrospora]
DSSSGSNAGSDAMTPGETHPMAKSCIGLARKLDGSKIRYGSVRTPKHFTRRSVADHGQYECDGDDELNYQGDTDDHNITDLDLPLLRQSVSTPDIVMMPVHPAQSGQPCMIKKPDAFYEHLLSQSRSVKAQRWIKRTKPSRRHSFVRRDSADTTVESQPLSQSVASTPSPRIGQLTRRDTASTIDAPISIGRARSGSQKPQGSLPRSIARRRQFSQFVHDPASQIQWSVWTDSLNASGTLTDSPIP